MFECLVIRKWHYLGRIRKWALVGRSVSLKVGSEVSKAQVRPSVSLFLLPVDLDIELLATSPAPCLTACCHTSHHAMLPMMMIMDYTSETVSQSQLKLSFIRVAVFMLSFHSNRTLTRTVF